MCLIKIDKEFRSNLDKFGIELIEKDNCIDIIFSKNSFIQIKKNTFSFRSSESGRVYIYNRTLFNEFDSSNFWIHNEKLNVFELELVFKSKKINSKFNLEKDAEIQLTDKTLGNSYSNKAAFLSDFIMIILEYLLEPDITEKKKACSY